MSFIGVLIGLNWVCIVTSIHSVVLEDRSGVFRGPRLGFLIESLWYIDCFGRLKNREEVLVSAVLNFHSARLLAISLLILLA
jgi:hypothetical protein